MPKVSRPRGTRRGEPLGRWGALFGTVPAILSPRSGHGIRVPGFERIEAPPGSDRRGGHRGSLADFVKALRTGEVPNERASRQPRELRDGDGSAGIQPERLPGCRGAMSGLAYRRDEQRLQRMSMELTASKRARLTSSSSGPGWTERWGEPWNWSTRRPTTNSRALDCGGAASITIKLGAQENLLEGADLVEKFAFAQSVGLDGIELHGAGGGAFAERMDELRAARRAGVAHLVGVPHLEPLHR